MIDRMQAYPFLTEIIIDNDAGLLGSIGQKAWRTVNHSTGNGRMHGSAHDANRRADHLPHLYMIAPGYQRLTGRADMLL